MILSSLKMCLSFQQPAGGLVRRACLPSSLSFSTSSKQDNKDAAKKAYDEVQQGEKPEEPLPKPTYTYASPGSSIHDPSLGFPISLSEPVYATDPAKVYVVDPVKPKPPHAHKKGADAAAESGEKPGSDNGAPPANKGG